MMISLWLLKVLVLLSQCCCLLGLRTSSIVQRFNKPSPFSCVGERTTNSLNKGPIVGKPITSYSTRARRSTRLYSLLPGSGGGDNIPEISSNAQQMIQAGVEKANQVYQQHESSGLLRVALDKPLFDRMQLSGGFTLNLAAVATMTLATLLISTSAPWQAHNQQDGGQSSGFDYFNEDTPTQPKSKWLTDVVEGMSPRQLPFKLLKTIVSISSGLLAGLSHVAAKCWSGIGGRSGRCLPLDEWNACSLVAKQHLANNKFTRYTFALPHPYKFLGLEWGEKLVMMALDESMKVCTATTLPIQEDHQEQTLTGRRYLEGKSRLSTRRHDGLFDVMIDNFNEEEGESFAALLDSLSLGDEITVCGDGGSFLEPSQRVKELYCFVHGIGITTALPFLRELLDHKQSSITACNLMWVNKRESEFLLADQVESLWEKHNQVLDVSSILDKFNSVSSFCRNNAFLEVFPEQYVCGTMVVIAGPSHFASSVTRLLMDRGFPPSAIATIN